jgi:hypothetical protein
VYAKRARYYSDKILNTFESVVHVYGVIVVIATSPIQPYSGWIPSIYKTTEDYRHKAKGGGAVVSTSYSLVVIYQNNYIVWKWKQCSNFNHENVSDVAATDYWLYILIRFFTL